MTAKLSRRNDPGKIFDRPGAQQRMPVSRPGHNGKRGRNAKQRRAAFERTDPSPEIDSAALCGGDI